MRKHSLREVKFIYIAPCCSWKDVRQLRKVPTIQKEAPKNLLWGRGGTANPGRNTSRLEMHTTWAQWPEMAIHLVQGFLEAKAEGITIYT